MLNTPPTFSWYIAGLVFAWLKRQGGLARMGEINQRKADKLYQAIDASGFYRNPVAPALSLLDERAVHAARCRTGCRVPRRSGEGRAGRTQGPSLGRRHARQHL